MYSTKVELFSLFSTSVPILKVYISRAKDTCLIQPLGPHGERVKLLGEVVDGQAVVGFGGVVPKVDPAVDVDEGALADDGGVGGGPGGGEELSVGREREAAEDTVREAIHVSADGAVAEAALPAGEDAGRASRRGQRGHGSSEFGHRSLHRPSRFNSSSKCEL